MHLTHFASFLEFVGEVSIFMLTGIVGDLWSENRWTSFYISMALGMPFVYWFDHWFEGLK